MHEEPLASARLKESLDRLGSDKGEWYGGLYETLLAPHRYEIRCLYEIGIGTMIPDAVSSMSQWARGGYQPGASLRAWRDFLPNAEIHGFDVASDTQFDQEPRITTHLCDSTNTAAISALIAQLNRKADVVVDDGLHSVEAQIGTLRNFLPAVQKGGLYVVEDVIDAHRIPEIRHELSRLCPAAHSFVYQTTQSWAAIVIRVPGAAAYS